MAFEEAGASIVTPENTSATLGATARDMKNQRNWNPELGEDAKRPLGDLVCTTVHSLWEGQESRHGGNGCREPTQGEAGAAVMRAVLLLQW